MSRRRVGGLTCHVISAPPTLRERQLLAAARAGDSAAFGQLVEANRASLHVHCYRMLGSLHDADDALQEALLRAWRALPRFDGRSALGTWLYRIATNACLDAIARRPKRVLPIDYEPRPGDPDGPLPGSTWIEPYPGDSLEDVHVSPDARYEQREAVELAFIATLQHLPARQRAVLILRDALGFSAGEVAAALETTQVSVNSALQRARKSVAERLPERSQQATLRSLGDERARAIVERFADALEHGDVDAIVDMLAEDATFAMPPYAGFDRGREAVADSWLMPSGPAPRLRCLPLRASGQLAVGAYKLDPDRRRYVPVALDLLTLRGARIADVTAFRAVALFPRFGLPDALPA